MAKAIQVTMDSENIPIIRYIIIPLIGFLVGFFLFIIIIRRKNALRHLDDFVSNFEKRAIFFLIIAFSSYSSLLLVARYFLNNFTIFDFGVYDIKLWQIAHADFSDKFKIASTYNFQPILVFYSLWYNISESPWILLILQVAAIGSAAIPLYLICKTFFKSPFLRLSIVLLYFLYPATQFNTFFDFHPDHLIIPLLFWCYYFVEKEKYIWLTPFLILSFMIKQPLILTIAFMGIYIAWGKKNYAFGFILFFASIIIFYVATFIVIPISYIYTNNKTITVIESNAFSYLFEAGGIIPKLGEIFSPEKWRFFFFLLLPLLFLSIFGFKLFLPAVPIFGIHILSRITHHQNVASHYTAGIIAPVFVSLISVLSGIRNKFGERIVLGILAWIVIMMLAFNVAHSPSPLAIAFWNKDWSKGKWHYSNYIRNGSDIALQDAISLIPADPSVKVVTHSEIYHKKLTHRYFYGVFPEKWQEADYILLDSRRGPYVSDRLDEVMYQQKLQELKDNSGFKIIFDKDGILVFTRRK